MSEQQYLKALNREIQKLNGIIDNKILYELNYRRESIRHKKLLMELRKVRMNRSIHNFLRNLRPSWYWF